MELSASRLWMSRKDGEAEPIAEIVARAITGDRAAFEDIVMLHERRVLTLAYRLLGTKEDAQDAAQDVFLRAFKYLRRFDASKPLEPWLVRMTVNVCRGAGRKRLKQRGLFTQKEGASYVDPSKNPHAQLYAEEQKRLLYAALADLGDKERAAVVLRDIEGFTTLEVAEILGSAEATVRSQISVARLKIRKAIGRLKGGHDGLS
jgi:RNA polymerase sigma-70 factor (ECF subfamily)